MRRSRSALLGLIAIASVGAVGASACRTPTEIVVHIRTNVPCTDGATWHGVAVYTGAPGIDVETRAPVLTTSACDATGNIGSLVLVPTGANDAVTSVRVVAGVSLAPEDCAARAYAGCIVARRTFTFAPHDALDVEINMTSDCVGEECDALTTCVAHVCLDSRLSKPTAPASSTEPQDAGAKAQGPTVRCGDDGVRCPVAGNVCCLTVTDGGAHGVCMDSMQCPATSIVLRCDDESDCPGRDDAGRPNVCCLAHNGGPGGLQDPVQVSDAVCLSYGECVRDPNIKDALELCQDRNGCIDHTKPCVAGNEYLPGYYWCNLP